jgi:hypothetical protein
MKIEKAVLRVHPAPGKVPLTMVGVSTISGNGAWNEGRQRSGAAEAGSANYYFAQAERQPWAYPGSDVTDVTFGLGGSLYAYRRARPVDDGWYEIDVPPALVIALATGDQFGWMLTDEKGQTHTRHALSSREGKYPPVLVVEGVRSGGGAPGTVRVFKEAGAPGSVVLAFGGAGAARWTFRRRITRCRARRCSRFLSTCISRTMPRQGCTRGRSWCAPARFRRPFAWRWRSCGRACPTS